MLASVAHELNNPLAIAMGRAALLEERVLAATDAASPAAWAVRDDARRVREASERCARIVTSFLDFARQRPPSRRAVALAEVVRTATDLVGHRLRSQGVQLDLALPHDLPTVVADFDHLVQVLLNLLLNAQQAMEGQAGERRIRVAAGVCGGSGEAEPARVVWLTVEDTGPGVPDALRERLFEPFFTTKEGGQGTGLGLSISRGLLQEHGGSLQLESTRPGATCFRLTLPLVRPTTEPAAARVPPPAATDDAVSLPPADTAALARVLVVDDDPDMAELVLATLETAGYEVAIAESGSVALELLAEARFDAVVGTLHLPDLDALALQQALLERQPALATRSLYLTGDALSERVAQLLRQLGRPHLEKPFTRAALLQEVRRLVAD
jgi:two-component system NtrC family sensor kinase